LKEEPRRHTEIIEALDAPQSTTQARLERLSDKGVIVRSDDGLWSAV
jgi:predicted transcriptional regulator